jgi:hypothetical protein
VAIGSIVRTWGNIYQMGSACIAVMAAPHTLSRAVEQDERDAVA